MKKLGKFLVVGAVAAVACAALVGCGEFTGTCQGEYKYANTHAEGTYYGVSVTVEVKDGTITKVTCADDTATMFNVTASWDGHDAAVAALPEYLKKFEGKKVADIKALNVATVSAEEAGGYSPEGQPKTDADSVEGWKDYVLTGATQTGGRIILAIQAALKDVK